MTMPTPFTADNLAPEEHKLVRRKIGNYVVTVVTSPTNEFIDVAEIAVAKDFRSFDQRLQRGVHNVDEFYEDVTR